MQGNSSPSTDEVKEIIQEIRDKGYLNDRVIHAAMYIIRKAFPNSGGMRDTVHQYKTNLPYDHRTGIQLLHVKPNHWVCSHKNTKGEYIIMDSLNKGPTDHIIRDIETLHQSTPSHGTISPGPPKIIHVPVTQQTGPTCAIHSIANGVSWLWEKDPSTITWEADKIHDHLISWFQNPSLNQAPMFPYTTDDRTPTPPNLGITPTPFSPPLRPNKNTITNQYPNGPDQEHNLPNKTRYATPKRKKDGTYTWTDIQIRNAGQGRGKGLFSIQNDIQGLLIPILGDRITDETLIDLEKQGLASHTWSFSRTTHIKQYIKGAINGLASDPSKPTSSLYVAMMIYEPITGKEPNCIFKQGHILVTKNPGKNNELTI